MAINRYENLTKNYSVYREILLETKNRSFLGMALNIVFSIIFLTTISSLFGYKEIFFILTFAMILLNLVRALHHFYFEKLNLKYWHLIFSLLIALTGSLWSTLLCQALDQFPDDLRVISMVQLLSSGILATTSYSLSLSNRDYYLLALQIVFNPFLFFIWNDKLNSNNAFLFFGTISFFALISLIRRDHAIQWLARERQKNTQKENEIALLLATKMAALGEMSSSLAHEINNPLGLISAQVTQLSKAIEATHFSEKEKNKFEVGLQRIYKTVFRISGIVKGLSQIARNDISDPKERTKVQDIIKETLALCETKCKIHVIQIKNQLPAEPIWISCHPAQIGQVILNLLNNSIYAVEKLNERWIEISFFIESDMLYLNFKDSGTGIERSVRDKLMTPFFTTKPVGLGTGLGLSISKTIIQQHNGDFYYDESAINTTFVVKLPIDKVGL